MFRCSVILDKKYVLIKIVILRKYYKIYIIFKCTSNENKQKPIWWEKRKTPLKIKLKLYLCPMKNCNNVKNNAKIIEYMIVPLKER